MGVSLEHNENEITFAIKFLIYTVKDRGYASVKIFQVWEFHSLSSSSVDVRVFDLPQYDQCAVDVSVAVPFDMVVEHIVSFGETLHLSLLMDQALESSSEQVVQVQSMDCMDY